MKSRPIGKKPKISCEKSSAQYMSSAMRCARERTLRYSDLKWITMILFLLKDLQKEPTTVCNKTMEQDGLPLTRAKSQMSLTRLAQLLSIEIFQTRTKSNF